MTRCRCGEPAWYHDPTKGIHLCQPHAIAAGLVWWRKERP